MSSLAKLTYEQEQPEEACQHPDPPGAEPLSWSRPGSLSWSRPGSLSWSRTWVPVLEPTWVPVLEPTWVPVLEPSDLSEPPAVKPLQHTGGGPGHWRLLRGFSHYCISFIWMLVTPTGHVLGWIWEK